MKGSPVRIRAPAWSILRRSRASHPFQNNGSQAGTLNWMFSEGGTASTVNATGNVLNPFPASINFVYANRLEGQWIFSGGGAVTTVNLHAFNGGSSCEVRGTAEWAPTQ